LLPSAIERDHWIQQAVYHLNITSEALQQMITNARTRERAAAQKNAANLNQPQTGKDEKTSVPHMRIMLEERIMALLQEEFSLFEEIQKLIDGSCFTDAAYAGLYNAWKVGYTRPSTPNIGGSITAPVKDSTLELLLSAVYSDLGSKERQIELRTLAARLSKIYLTEQRETLIREIQRAEAAGNHSRLGELLVNYQKLIT
jgi:hypothetical protein